MTIFDDYGFEGGALIAKETGAQIPLNRDFLSDAVRIGSFVWLINALRATRLVKGREPRARISFFPKKPRSYYAIWPVCQMADVQIVDDPAEADIHFYFEDREFLLTARPAPSTRPAFNIGCFDIRKSVVARCFHDVFGYSLALDPTSWTGPAVEKSEANGRHDGRIIQCPVPEPQAGQVYQRLIDNTFDGKTFIDIRTPVVGGKIPFVYLKYRLRQARFSNENDRVDLTAPDSVLSRTEQAQIADFAHTMRLDFGGLDILRDRSDGKIYIVDVNKTDMGPPSKLSAAKKLTAIRGLADSFAELIDARLAGS